MIPPSMTNRMLFPILGAIAVSALIACTSVSAEPTTTPRPWSTPEPTVTPQPTLTFAPRAASTPTTPPTATRTRLTVPTRAPATATPAVAPLAPIIWDTRLDALGITLVSATIPPGQAYWRLVKAEFWDEKERQGKHHIFVDALDENGVRLIGQKIVVDWPGDRLILVTEDKPAPEYSANFPLDVNHYPPWGTLGAFTVWIDGLPSDKVAGMGLPPKNKFVVYLLTFQRTAR